MVLHEIIFRGKRLDNGEWVCGGSIIRFNKEQGEDCDLVFMPQYDEKCLCTHDANDNIIAWDKTMFYKIDPYTVGQFTGLTDRNGKRIFEGDIMEGDLHDKRDPSAKWRMEVTWLPFGWGGANQYGADIMDELDCKEGEVIGNIHDNPELLERGRE